MMMQSGAEQAGVEQHHKEDQEQFSALTVNVLEQHAVTANNVKKLQESAM